eukprot:3852982-Rhodomonas_salina.3
MSGAVLSGVPRGDAERDGEGCGCSGRCDLTFDSLAVMVWMEEKDVMLWMESRPCHPCCACCRACADRATMYACADAVHRDLAAIDEGDAVVDGAAPEAFGGGVQNELRDIVQTIAISCSQWQAQNSVYVINDDTLDDGTRRAGHGSA